MAVIYHIENYEHKHYVGKLEDTSSGYPYGLVYHWNNIYKVKKYSANFEHEWAKYVSENGMNTGNNYVYRTHSIPVEDALVMVRDKLADAIQNVCPSEQNIKKIRDWWIKAFQTHWNFNDKEMCEVFLICLAYKSHHSTLNYQIDHMGSLNNNQREAQSFLNGMISPADIQKKLDVAEIPMFYLPRSITIENLQSLEPAIQDVILPTINDKKIHVNKQGNKSVTLDWTKFPQFVDSLSSHLAKETDEVFDEQFPKYMNNFAVGSQIRTELEKIYKQAQRKSKKEKLKTLLTNYNDNRKKIRSLTIDYLNEGTIKNFDGKEQLFCDIYNEFYKISHFHRTFMDGYADTSKQLKAVKEIYLDQFIEYIANEIFKPTYNEFYERHSLNTFKEQQELQEEPFHYTSWYYRDYLTNGLLQNVDYRTPGSWMHDLITELDKLHMPSPDNLPFIFVQQNWNEIYNEQVSYWMNNNHPNALVIAHRSLFYRLPELIDNKKRMTWF